MVKNIIYIVILAVIGIPSWQIGGIIFEKKNVTHTLREQANSIKKHHRIDLIQKYTKEKLEAIGLPTEFSLEALGLKKVKLGYTYYGAATIFGYTYYETTEDMEAVTEDGIWDN
ncbi:MAG: hypothetical protein D3903_01760 [Candidatus Electrothrix sp. GM3_4]|nr:hypothetical protein [Candidatus Electrothrix sp. GM3_4]